MKQTGMLVVSLRGVNFGFWSSLGSSTHSTKRNRSYIFFLICFVFVFAAFRDQNLLKPRPKWCGHKKLEPRPDGLL